MAPRAHDLEDLRWKRLATSEESSVYQGGLFPESFSVRLSHPRWPAEVDLHVVVDRDRGPVPTGLVVQHTTAGDAGTPSYLEMHEAVRAVVGMPELLREVTADAVAWIVTGQLIEQAHKAHPESHEARLAAVGKHAPLVSAVRDLTHEKAQPRRRRLLNNAYLREVAETYRGALAQGLPPTQEVQIRYGTSYSNAAKLVRKARDAGLLGAATGPRPGEAAHD